MSLPPFNASEEFGEITGNVIGVQLASEKLHEGRCTFRAQGVGPDGNGLKIEALRLPDALAKPTTFGLFGHVLVTVQNIELLRRL
jgi:hypothetical protein